MSNIFNFRNKLLENGSRVLTENIARKINVEINSNPAQLNPTGTWEIITNEDSSREMKINLSLPKGDKGDMPTLGMGVIKGLAPYGTNTDFNSPTAEIVEAPENSEYDYLLNLGIPRGEPGVSQPGPNGPQGDPGPAGYSPKVLIENEVNQLEQGEPLKVENTLTGWGEGTTYLGVTTTPITEGEVEPTEVKIYDGRKDDGSGGWHYYNINNKDIVIYDSQAFIYNGSWHHTYNPQRDVSLRFSIPKGDTGPRGPDGIPAKITNVGVAAIDSEGTASVISTTNYNPETKTNETTLSFKIPKGEKGEQGEKGVPTWKIGSVTSTLDPEEVSVSSIPDPDGEVDYVLDFVLPQGKAGELVEINSSGDYSAVTNITIDPDDPSKLNVNYDGIPASDITSGTLPVERGGTGTTNFGINSILTGNNFSGIKAIRTGEGAFYAESQDGAAKFGILPVSLGGTGVTSINEMKTNLGIKEEVENLIDDIVVIQSEEPTSDLTKIWIKV